jgi:hypothetical protein
MEGRQDGRHGRRFTDRHEATFERRKSIAAYRYVVLTWFRQFAPQPAPRPVPVAQSTLSAVVMSPQADSIDLASLPESVSPYWPSGTHLSLEIYTSVSPVEPSTVPDETPLVSFHNLTYGAWDADQSRFADVYVDVPEEVRLHNASMWADIFLLPEATGSAQVIKDVLHIRKPLTKYAPPRKIRKEVSLLGGNSTEDKTEDLTDGANTLPTIVSHWSPNLTLSLVTDSGTLKYRAQPPQVRTFINLAPEKKAGAATYYPILYPNEFWHLTDSLIALNGSSSAPSRLPLRIACAPLSMWKFNLYAHMNTAFEQQAQAKASGATAGPMGASGGADLDELKKMLISANPYWLAITIIVTLLHTL